MSLFADSIEVLNPGMAIPGKKPIPPYSLNNDHSLTQYLINAYMFDESAEELRDHVEGGALPRYGDRDIRTLYGNNPYKFLDGEPTGFIQNPSLVAGYKMQPVPNFPVGGMFIRFRATSLADQTLISMQDGDVEKRLGVSITTQNFDILVGGATQAIAPVTANEWHTGGCSWADGNAIGFMDDESEAFTYPGTPGSASDSYNIGFALFADVWHMLAFNGDIEVIYIWKDYAPTLEDFNRLADDIYSLWVPG